MYQCDNVTIFIIRANEYWLPDYCPRRYFDQRVSIGLRGTWHVPMFICRANGHLTGLDRTAWHLTCAECSLAEPMVTWRVSRGRRGTWHVPNVHLQGQWSLDGSRQDGVAFDMCRMFISRARHHLTCMDIIECYISPTQQQRDWLVWAEPTQ